MELFATVGGATQAQRQYAERVEASQLHDGIDRHLRYRLTRRARSPWLDIKVQLSSRVARRIVLPDRRTRVDAELAAHVVEKRQPYSIAGSGNGALTSGLNDFAWACIVLTSFPRAMLIMAGSFGLWQAKLISNALFAVGVLAVVLVLAGGATWLSGGFWAPDGVYFAVRLADHRPRVGRGREPSLDPQSCYSRWMVMPTLAYDFEGEPRADFRSLG